jgi:hypothetical protein
MSSPAPSGKSLNLYDFSKSDLTLMVGSQIMLLVLVIMVLYFGVEPIEFAYQEQVRSMIHKLS